MHRGMLFHPLSELETLFFHAADGRRVLVCDEKYLHV